MRPSERARTGCKLARTLQDEGVNAIGRVGIRRVESVMDEEREAEAVGLEGGESERPVFLEALGARHPVEHVLARHRRALGKRHGAQRELFPDVLRFEGVGHRLLM
ncbi:MAG: hypothetical protein JJD97_00780 [Gemmatimonadaceae bacterium]|nr:hypothetical protein [Gemmatimonadaceae bacterium]